MVLTHWCLHQGLLLQNYNTLSDSDISLLLYNRSNKDFLILLSNRSNKDFYNTESPSEIKTVTVYKEQLYVNILSKIWSIKTARSYRKDTNQHYGCILTLHEFSFFLFILSQPRGPRDFQISFVGIGTLVVLEPTTRGDSQVNEILVMLLYILLKL